MSFSFDPPPRRPRAESVAPMINVVFLLLVFFLMTSTLAPSEPLPVSPPVAEGGERPPAVPALHMSAGGEIAYRDARGPAAIAAFAADLEAEGGPAVLRIDGGAEGAAAARLLRDLSAAGVADAALTVAPQ